MALNFAATLCLFYSKPAWPDEKDWGVIKLRLPRANFNQINSSPPSYRLQLSFARRLGFSGAAQNF
jgi:hypothetical protein